MFRCCVRAADSSRYLLVVDMNTQMLQRHILGNVDEYRCATPSVARRLVHLSPLESAEGIKLCICCRSCLDVWATRSITQHRGTYGGSSTTKLQEGTPNATVSSFYTAKHKHVKCWHSVIWFSLLCWIYVRKSEPDSWLTISIEMLQKSQIYPICRAF